MSVVLDIRGDTDSPETAVVDLDYWVAHCEGFRAFGPDGWIGTITDVRTDEHDRATALSVRTGLFRPRQHVVDVGEVERVEPWRKVAVLVRDPRDVDGLWPELTGAVGRTRA